MPIINLEHCGNPILNEDQYYPALSMILSISIIHRLNQNNSTYEYVYDYSKGDLYLLYRLLNDVDWSELETTSNVAKCIDMFYQKVYECLDLAIPKRKIKKCTSNAQRYPIYFSQELKKNIKLKKRLHRQIKNGKASFQLKNEYNEIRSAIKYQTTTKLS
ncbi:unnamed protein product [Acanthoscelides obtectus]|uniref:Uncharacterized protein n=1 Tax=Acanthoscelides obtectus TaxID=200917 RepID=A0A9P0PC38_ACAOB|nr:unnamed protein product [Acanthoscelides obtectus]CAK1655110.1 hypothetical protein AOBTE_LOCUS19031 [Acanthoscelides obtectus]